MRYWLTAIAAAGLTIAAGWVFLLNQGDVIVRIAPSRSLAAPLGGILLAAFLLGALVIGVLSTGGAIARGWRGAAVRRRARRDARGREAIARVRDLLWTGETSAARAELLRVPEDAASEVSRLALLAETHLQDGEPGAARELLARAPAEVVGDPRLQDLLARAAQDLGDRPAAIAALERAYRAMPGSPRLAGRLRDLYAAEGRWSDAVALQAEVLLQLRSPSRLAAERETLVGLRYQATLEETDHLRAARQLRALARDAPDFIPAWVSAGDRYAEAGRAFSARRTWVRGLRRRPSAILLDRIDAHDAAAGRAQRTPRLLRALIRRAPGAVLSMHLARHLLARGALDEAAALLDDLSGVEPARVDALRGELLRARGDAQGAMDAFARALGPDLGLRAPWRCLGCTAIAPRWSPRCAACGRWDTLRSPAEEERRTEDVPTSEGLMRPAK